jgi:hypothetical protein
MLDTMNLKIDAMTSHGFDYRNVNINNLNKDTGCQFCKEKGRVGKHSNEKCWFNPQSIEYKPNYKSKRNDDNKAESSSVKKVKQVKVNNLQTNEEDEEEEEEVELQV